MFLLLTYELVLKVLSGPPFGEVLSYSLTDKAYPGNGEWRRVSSERRDNICVARSAEQNGQ